jgi:mannose-6-phosphate isomerase-like protein (cupin superfamily)
VTEGTDPPPSPSPDGGRRGVPGADPDLDAVEVATLPTEDAYLVKGRLESEGITAEVYSHGYPVVDVFGSQVVVRRRDEQRAKEIVEEAVGGEPAGGGARLGVHAVDSLEEAEDVLAEERCSAPSTWSNGAGDTYERHAHDYHKVLFCIDGSITFHTDGGDIEMLAGDRLDLPPGTTHSATVGPEGCSCVEGYR